MAAAVSIRAFFTKFPTTQGSSKALRCQSILWKKEMHTLLCSKGFVNGEWVDAQSGKTFDVTNPANGKLIGTVPDMNVEDVQESIDHASAAFQSWKEVTAKERGIILRKWFELMMEHQHELSKILTAEQGKPLSESMTEISYAASFFEWYSEEARRIYGEVVPSPVKNREMIFIRQPVGVSAMITPWNFPSAMITRKVGAAMAAGCTCIVKPAEDTPLSALALAKLAEQAKVPPGVLNVITASTVNSPQVGKLLCESPVVAALSFTGSVGVGKILYRQCASTVKRISLELGGNAPFIVFDSADVDAAANAALFCKFRNAGQTCVSLNRLLVQEGIHDQFVQKFAELMGKKLILGNGLDPETTQGPLINKQQVIQVGDKVQDAVDKGAKLLCGGKLHEQGGLFYEPTLLTEVKGNMRVCEEEIFGPVAVVVKFRNEEEALAIANSASTGLAGYFFSNDVNQVWRVAKKLEVGMVGINEGAISCAEGVFGGIKESGIGREGSHHGIEEYTELKYLAFGNLT